MRNEALYTALVKAHDEIDWTPVAKTGYVLKGVRSKVDVLALIDSAVHQLATRLERATATLSARTGEPGPENVQDVAIMPEHHSRRQVRHPSGKFIGKFRDCTPGAGNPLIPGSTSR